MNSRVSSSDEGVDPSVWERAEAAARRAGMSLNDWLDTNLGEFAHPDFRISYDQRRPAMAGREGRDFADIHHRLDAIARQIEQVSQPRPRGDAAPGAFLRTQPPVARQLNDAIARLEARLSQLSNPHHYRQPPQMQDRLRDAEMIERAANQAYRPSPPLSPASLDFAVAETAPRQDELDDWLAPPQATASSVQPAMSDPSPEPPSVPAGPDFSSLERHLLQIASQIEALQRPDHIDESIAAFRQELSEIRLAITEAMPRRAIESIEDEIRSLSRRIDDTRQSGIDSQALAGIEHALGEIHEVLRSLTPAEQLAGYDEAIRNLTAKLDQILRANDDPSTIRQLEGAIAALRAIVANVASNEALERLGVDVQVLSSKVDQLVRADRHADSFAVLEQRIAALAMSLENRELRPVVHEHSEHIENALRALSDRLDRLPVGNDNASAFAHLEQRVSHLLERLEVNADHRTGNLSRVEEGLQDILHQLERQHASLAAVAATSRNESTASDSGFTDLVKRELSDIRFSQAETDRHTQGSLEAVHNTLGHVVDRLGMIEGDLRAARVQVPAAQPETAFSEYSPPPAPAFEAAPAPKQAQPPLSAIQPKPELPDPAEMQEYFDAAPRDFHSASTAVPAPAAVPQAISEILEPHAAPPRPTVEPPLPPDHPLEPGTRPPGRPASPSERIAASESAISEIPAASREPVSTSSFIAAARRAAQAAAAAPPPEKAGRRAKGSPGGPSKHSSITSKIRSLLVGASVVVIVLGTFKMAMTLLDTGSLPQMPAMENSSEPHSAASPSGEDGTGSTAPTQVAPSMTSPTPIGRQSFNDSAADPADGSASVAIPQTIAVPSASTANDVTGTVQVLETAPNRGKFASIPVPPSERLLEAIGGATLRDAGLKGDPTAAYEIGVRFADGKGVVANYDEAVKWLDRAARGGVVPAIFRLGTFYEKGLAVTKDIDIARRYYLQAAERGNAKAIHNLAVLDADGGGNSANYKSAAQWFRKAADRGVADSQYNLGILYARGIGVEQNLAESFKWFSLAAAQGDLDAGRKRDDVAKRLDPQSLAAARLAIQTFTPEPQPDDAVNVATPQGGWDFAPAQASPAKPAVKPVASKRTAAAH